MTDDISQNLESSRERSRTGNILDDPVLKFLDDVERAAWSVKRTTDPDEDFGRWLYAARLTAVADHFSRSMIDGTCSKTVTRS